MKTKIFTTAALVCCFMVSFAIIAGLAGKWTGTLKSPDGSDFTLTYAFKTDSGKLTGSVSSPQGEIPITEGKLDGDNFGFNVDVGGTTVKNTGKLYDAADSIGLDIDFGGQKFHTTLKRDNK